ncbi:MAG: bacteriohopanetetrol glucosamine biosynthesis glycosyltransferase HpnI [Alphaproteobacteria bacterium]|nr:bacteriohopanetetrol glucosamine biosynthesis glycosyltransferase HpnI [Alphaproteobacteria bacterium]
MMVRILADIGMVASLVGIVYLIAAAWLVRSFAREIPPPPQERPPVTILKPVCGDEPGLYDNLRSFCTQDYPEVQVVFGVRDPEDTAVPTIRRLMAALPGVAMDLVIDGRLHGTNYKVSNLINMMAVARHDILVVADSDMRVGPDYLGVIVASLLRPGVGAVTCLYTGRASGNVWSILGAAWINATFLPSVLVGRAVGGVEGCFGATMALCRDTLNAFGGFEALRNHLADDYALGALVRRSGHAVVLAPHVPEHAVAEATPGELLRHELRWSRTIAAIAPVSFAASMITNPVALAVVAVALAGGAPVAWGGLALAVACRFATMRWIVHSLGCDPIPMWAIPPRDLLSFVTLVAAFFGRSVTWRGHRFRVGRDGLLIAEKSSLS